MIRVQFFRDKLGRALAYQVDGHAGFASRGRDIVCAAVSALAEACANGIAACGIPHLATVGDGSLSVITTRSLTVMQAVELKAIMDTLRIALVQLEAQYPDYIHVKDWRCEK